MFYKVVGMLISYGLFKCFTDSRWSLNILLLKIFCQVQNTFPSIGN